MGRSTLFTSPDTGQGMAGYTGLDLGYSCRVRTIRDMLLKISGSERIGAQGGKAEGLVDAGLAGPTVPGLDSRVAARPQPPTGDCVIRKKTRAAGSPGWD